MKTGDESLTARGKLDSLTYEPQRPNPQNKAAPSKSAPKQIDASVRGGVCRSVTAVADAGVCARTRAALRVWQEGQRNPRSEDPDRGIHITTRLEELSGFLLDIFRFAPRQAEHEKVSDLKRIRISFHILLEDVYDPDRFPLRLLTRYM
jgi:hypothetical protein